MIVYITIFFLLFLLLILLVNTSSLKSFPIFTENFKSIEVYELPKIIFTYWDNEDENHIVNSFLQTWRNNIKSWKFVILNKKNITKYVDKDFIKKYENNQKYLFSDFLRLYLLYNYGGAWFDSTSIFINDNFLDVYRAEMFKNKHDVTLYELKGGSGKYPYLENWFIMAPKKSRFIGDLFSEFSNAYDMSFIKYKRKVLNNSNIELDKTLKGKKSTNIYLMQHAIIHYLLDKGNKYNINIKDAEESMFKVHKLTEWKDNEIINFIINNNDWSNFYAIKLTKGNRSGINDKNKKALIERIIQI